MPKKPLFWVVSFIKEGKEEYRQITMTGLVKEKHKFAGDEPLRI